MKISEETVPGYREQTRRRLQELMISEGYSPSHPLVTSTSLHLDFTTAVAASAMYSAPNPTSFYQGCDLFYKVPCRPATPLSPVRSKTVDSPIC